MSTHVSEEWLDRLLGAASFPAAGDARLYPVQTRLEAGMLLNGAILVFDDHQRHLALEMLRHVENCDDAAPFAADIFGDFWIVTGRGTVWKVETETLTIYPDEDRCSLAEWARTVLQDPGVAEEEAFAIRWQEQHGPLSANQRLTPTYPFMLKRPEEGFREEFFVIDLDELYAVRTDFALQTRDLPDGARILIETVD